MLMTNEMTENVEINDTNRVDLCNWCGESNKPACSTSNKVCVHCYGLLIRANISCTEIFTEHPAGGIN